MNPSESQRSSLNQRIFGAESSLPVTFDQLRVCYDDHRDEGALDELVVRHIEVRRTPGGTHYVLVHVATSTTAFSHDQAVGYVAVTDVPSSQSSLPPDCLHSLLHKLPLKKAPRTASAQFIDHDALVLPKDDVCLLQQTFPTPCPFACLIAAGLSVGPRLPAPGHGKPRSSWFAALMFWLLAGEERADSDEAYANVELKSRAAIDQKRCGLEHTFARMSGAAVWQAQVDRLEKEAARGG
ncbi:hypothetical protein K466DRAFT_590006 [Polyporus arcularius HHB13444]|uniref:Uncharacterized protein n=1 Tax=Polyporus arcularius HHB13444 TaxID=1314778 RepID=A0A5C3P1C3_9APHY|nr:hypothetical protein K466DRAFT_590006 [Polyporus arcularius HHB13444]